MADEKQWLTCEEWLEKYEPVWKEMKDKIRPCIAGLTTYAANLAVAGRADDVAMLRQRVDMMSGFWFGGYENHTERFDLAIADAVKGGIYQPITDEGKAAVLEGLAINNRQMACDLDDDDETIAEFDELSEWLGSQWSPEEQITQDYGGMTFG